MDMVNKNNAQEPLLSIKDLTVSFKTTSGEVKAVRGVSYDVFPGEVMGLVGESGSGKSVSAFSILGLVSEPGKITGGSIRFMGKELVGMTEKEYEVIRGRDIAMIFQDPMTALNPVFTVGNQIDEVLEKHTDMDKEARKKRILELFELVGINEPARRITQYPHELSGGMRQRVVIAMALACNPKLLIADEPTTALDVTIQNQILELLKDLKDRFGMSIVFITHDLGVVADICDWVSVMYAGNIVEKADIEALYYHPGHPYTKGLLESVPRLESGDAQRLITIEGNPVDLRNTPAGCAFAPRCRECMKICREQQPPVWTGDSEHEIRCWLRVKQAYEEQRQARKDGQAEKTEGGVNNG